MKQITLIVFTLLYCIASSFGQDPGDKAFHEIQLLLHDDPINNFDKIYEKSFFLSIGQKRVLYDDYYMSGTGLAILNAFPGLSLGSWSMGWWKAGLIGTCGQVLGVWISRSENNTISTIGWITFSICWLYGVSYPSPIADDYNNSLSRMLRIEEFVPIGFYPTFNIDKADKMYPGLGISVGF